MTLFLSFLLALADGGTPTPMSPGAALRPPDTLVSPEVHPDGRITLRLRAPHATEVSVAGEWTHPTPNTPQRLTRDAQGIWSITVGPVEPNIYIYLFDVDGLIVPDPVNPSIKLRARGSASMVEVPGGQPWEFRDVPHGAIDILTHAAPSLGKAMRQIFVYTPPGYDGRTRYPILYLFHGTNDLAAGWTMAGRANLVLDNLLAEKKAVPMIVVMPWGHALPFGARPGPGQPTNNDVFEEYLNRDVMPLVEARYRVLPGRHNRAVVGLSMGGAQALQIGLRHRDLFASIGVFGSGMTRADFDARYKPAGPPLDLAFIGIGKEDGAVAKARELSETLQSHDLAATWKEVEGGHTYPTWRKLLVEIAPLLFRKPARPGAR